MNTAPFIAVEGPIGAGKTTLASMLSEKLSLSLVKEIVEENPFLDKFYDDKDEWSFQLEMFFLCNRYKQLEDTEKSICNITYLLFRTIIFIKTSFLPNGRWKAKNLRNTEKFIICLQKICRNRTSSFT